MAAVPQTYQRLQGKFRLSSDGLWIHSSHLLWLETRLFREQYTRLYWQDIQALELYPLPALDKLDLSLEGLCAIALLFYGISFHDFLWIALVLLFVLILAVTQVTAVHYGILLLTRTNAVRIPAASPKSKSLEIMRRLEGLVTGTSPQPFDQPQADPSPQAPLSATPLRLGPEIVPQPRPALWAHFTLCGLSIIGSLVGLLWFGRLNHPAVSVSLSLARFVILIATLISFLMQRKWTFPLPVKGLAGFLQVGGVLLALRALFQITGYNRSSVFNGGLTGPWLNLITLVPAISLAIALYREKRRRQLPASSGYHSILS